jgi:hypothetical protein
MSRSTHDPVPQITRAMVKTAARRVFPDAAPTEILAVLDRYGVESYEQEPERVRMGALKLSGGDRAALEHYIEVAKLDFRDVLAGAEYPGFLDAGFTGVEEMRPAERRRLVEADAKQHADWLEAHAGGE